MNAGEWIYFNTADTQWCWAYSPLSRWYTLNQTTLANGWADFTWPYAYDYESGVWYYLNQGDTLWCYHYGTGQWSRMGDPVGMKYIAAGSFQMGDSYYESDEDDEPVHTVYVSAFFMDRYEVSKGLWDEVYDWAKKNGYGFDNSGEGKASDHPVHTVNWFDAVKWCNARSQKEGRAPVYFTDAGMTQVYKEDRVIPYPRWSAKGYRLPTEAEWEKAARSGLVGQRFPWGETISHSQCNYYSYPGDTWYTFDVSPTYEYNPIAQDWYTYPLGTPYTTPCGLFPPSGGLHDMAGNVWEWCWDYYDDDYYASSPSNDPKGPDHPILWNERVLRGGAWSTSALSERCADRSWGGDGGEWDTGGFRCARNP